MDDAHQIFEIFEKLRLLLDLLPNRSAAVRVAVISAFWQMSDYCVLPHLHQAAERENVIEVRRTLEYVIRVLETTSRRETSW